MKYLSFGQVGDIPNCFLCNKEVKETERTAEISPNLSVIAHALCLKGFSGLVRLSEEKPREPVRPPIERVIKTVEGQPILIRRDFPNQKIPILLYLYHRKERGPIEVGEIYDWLEAQKLGMSNPSVVVQRLLRDNLVGIRRIGDTDYYLITDEGQRLVEEYLTSSA